MNVITLLLENLIKDNKVFSQFKDNIWGVDLADMQSLSKKNVKLLNVVSTLLLFH